jgi:hypothetical protein
MNYGAADLRETVSAWYAMAKTVQIKKDQGSAAAVVILLFYISFCVISYLYSLIYNRYNGDFMGTAPGLSKSGLRLSLFYSILPFLCAFMVYKSCAGITYHKSVPVPMNAFGFFLLLILLIQIYMSLVYGVGQMGKERYSAPFSIRVINLIVNRFEVRIGLSIYLLNVKKKDKLKYILIILLVVLSFCRLSLGWIAYLPFLYILCRYNGNIVKFLKKWIIPLALCIVFIPSIVGNLFDIRSRLRGSESAYARMPPERIIFGRLVGRMSSFSNSSFIMENEIKMKPLVKNMSPLQYLIEALFIEQPYDQLRYGNVILESAGNHTRTASYMNGLPGTLMISWYNSAAAFFVNVFVLISLIIIPCMLAPLFRCRRMSSLIFLIVCGSLVPGDAFSQSRNLVSLLVYLILFLFINFFIKWIPVRGENEKIII